MALQTATEQMSIGVSEYFLTIDLRPFTEGATEYVTALQTATEFCSAVTKTGEDRVIFVEKLVTTDTYGYRNRVVVVTWPKKVITIVIVLVFGHRLDRKPAPRWERE